jgi:hypothetical protein
VQTCVLFHQVETKACVELSLPVMGMDPLPEHLTVFTVCDKWLSAVQTCNVRLGEVVLPNGGYFSITGKTCISKMILRQ